MNIMAKSPQKVKTVENYVLESVQYINPDESEVWLARHKILKKYYMLKRVKYLKDTVVCVKSKEREDEVNALNLQRIVRQIQLLKHVKLPHSPKCQKMIKTTNCLYVVYDQFVGTSLLNFCQTQRTYEQKLRIMVKVGKALLSYHVKQIVFLFLSPSNILLQDNQNIFFCEWSLAIYKNNVKNIFPIVNTLKSIFIANEVLQENQCSCSADIFSLGQIYNYIINANTSNSQVYPQELKKLIVKMTDRNARHRPTLQQIIQSLEALLKDIPEELMPIQSRLTQSKSLLKSTKALDRSRLKRLNTVNTANDSKMKDTHSQDRRQKSSLDVVSSRSKTPSALSFDNILIGISRTLSKVQISRAKSNEGLVRKINKNRNLSYFIMDLSEFASSKPFGEELGYVLLKQAYLILNSCYVEWNNQDFQDKKSQQLARILKQEILQFNLSLNMLKEYFLSQDSVGSELKAQLRNDLIISDKFIRQRTIAFCNETMKEINGMISNNKVQSLNSLVNELFSVYMALKSVEEGSYQKYWDKIYTPQVAFLKNQKYFNEEKKLGYRYLKSKITQILSKK